MKILQNKKHFKGFTLLELIIVITILAILGTIAFTSYQNFTKDARDGVRLTDIKKIYDGMSVYRAQTETAILPDDYIEVRNGTGVLTYQGYVGTTVKNGIRLIKGGQDPLTQDNYIYATDKDKKKVQIMGYLETSDKEIKYLGYNFISKVQAKSNTGYYQDKKIYVYGDKIGILTDKNNVPLQETTTNTGIDLQTLTGTTTYFGGEVYENGTSTQSGTTLINQIISAIDGTLPCSAESYDSYSITSLLHNQSGTFTKSIGGINNGTKTGSLLITCKNGSLDYNNKQETFNLTCIDGYVPNNDSSNCIVNNCNLSIPTNGQSTATGQTITRSWTYSTTPGLCTFTCKTNYTYNIGTNTCDADIIANQACSGSPVSNAVWNSVSTINQTWDGAQWLPSTNGTYNETTSTSECRFKCNTNYTYNSITNTCDANTRTTTCGGSVPTNATATTSSNYTQTWNGNSWTPTTSWGENQATCDFNCNNNHIWKGSSCVLDFLDISNSLRFDGSRNTYLSRTPSIGNRQKWTWSGWIKRSGLSNGGTNGIFVVNTPASNSTGIQFYKDKIDVFFAGGYSYRLTTTNTYTDTSNWLHLTVSVDTTSSGGSNNVKIYVNNSLLSVFDTASYPITGYLTDVNNSLIHTIGKDANGSNLNGYLSEVNFIDGEALGPENFGVNIGGKWLPKSYTGNYGTNGFHLDFKDGITQQNLGKDVSERNNNLTVNNNQVTDQMIDSPTNNFATLNPATIGHPTWYPTGSISNGNLTMTMTDNHSRETDKYASSGKYYAEVFMTQNPVGVTMVGVRNFGYSISSVFGNPGDVGYINSGNKRVGTDSSYGASYVQGDIVGIALDLDNRSVEFYKGTQPQGKINLSSGVSYGFGVGSGYPNGTRILNFNFGQGGQSGLQYCAGAGGYFKYCPPDGFKALSSKNIGN